MFEGKLFVLDKIHINFKVKIMGMTYDIKIEIIIMQISNFLQPSPKNVSKKYNLSKKSKITRF